MSEAIAVAIIVDSSLHLASQWPQLLPLYVSGLLNCLLESRSSNQFHMAFVTYSTSDLRPTPLLAKRFFAHPQQVVKELKEEPQKLGIGRTGSGPRNGGMAALEGYVAALELFDLFLSSRESQQRTAAQAQQSPGHSATICHIIHIASSPADLATAPLWNQRPDFDSLNWKTLPEEFRKRNIHLSMILLRPDNHFSEFHKLVALRPNQTWLKVLPGHSVLLSGFPVQQQGAATSSKRPAEPSAVTDAKRVRVNAYNPSSSPAPPSSQPTTEKPPVSGQPAPRPANPTITGMQSSQIMFYFRNLDTQLRAQVQEIKAAQQAGRVQDAENLKKDLQMKSATYVKLRNMLAAQAQNMAGANRQSQPAAGPSNANRPEGNTNPAQASSSQLPQTSQTTDTAHPPVPSDPSAPDRAALANLIQNRFSQPLPPPPPGLPGPGALPIPANVPPDVAAQMQKLIEQRGRSPRMPQQPPVPQQPPRTIPAAAAPPHQPVGLKKPEAQTWHGTLVWSGFDAITKNRKDLSAEVTATGTSGGDIRADTWPPLLKLARSKERAVPTPDLHSWIKRHLPKICTIIAQARTVDGRVNDANFKSLMQLLSEQGFYALASWQLPTGKEEITMVIFPVPNFALAAAVFPDTGVPELPKASAPGPSPAQPIQDSVLNFLPGGIQNWPAQQKQDYLKKIAHFQQQKQQQQAQPNFQQMNMRPDGNQFGPGPSVHPSAMQGVHAGNVNQAAQNVTNMMGGMGMNQVHANAGFQRQLAGPVGGVPQGPGAMQNLTSEMVQSFLQRSQEGATGSGPG